MKQETYFIEWQKTMNMKYVELIPNLHSMKIRDSPKIGIKFTENNTSKFVNITDKKSNILIEFDYIIYSTNISKKQLDLYLWRHPEIETYKDGKIKYVSLDILSYIFTNKKKK